MRKKISLAATAEAGNPTETAGLLTTTELLEQIKISRRSLANHVKSGKLPVIKLGARCLYHWPSVLAALLRQQRGAQ